MLDLLQNMISPAHEQVSFFQDPATGVVGIVAIHSTVLGPSLGGCRMMKYGSIEEALFDVLRLSQGMTFKNSLAGLALGGGKSVLVADRALEKGRSELFESFARFVDTLGGRYYIAEDMGTSVSDMTSALRATQYVAGRDPAIGGGGDPSPWTALGVFQGMRACLERVFGSDSFAGRHVAIQGVGHVGRYLAKHLADAGARLTLADRRADVLAECCSLFGAGASTPEKIPFIESDVFAPCAVGGVLTKEAVPKLGAKIVAGAANNQVLGIGVEEMLAKRGILYAPDFAINAGGVILCADELEAGGFQAHRVRARVERIYDTIGRILDAAAASKQVPGKIAVDLAEQRIREARRP